MKDLHEWHVAKCDAHPLFRRLDGEEVEEDPCVQAMKTETEEGQKVARNGGSKYYAVYQRIARDQAASIDADSFFSKASPVAKVCFPLASTKSMHPYEQQSLTLSSSFYEFFSKFWLTVNHDHPRRGKFPRG